MALEHRSPDTARVGEVLWEPSRERVERSSLWRFMQAAPGAPQTYGELWCWSVQDPAAFWGLAWERCGAIASQPATRVMGEPRMPGTEWFSGARLNFAENLLRRRGDVVVAIGAGEGRPDVRVTGDELAGMVARAQSGLLDMGLRPGDRVAALVPNSVETLVLMLAATASGAVWSSCSPEFGVMGVVDRFAQIKPKILVTADGYRYNGTTHLLQDKVGAALSGLPSVEHVVVLPSVGADLAVARPSSTWEELQRGFATEPEFEQLPFDHPLYIMYSSGTTGPPKSIVHGAGGTLIKHLVEHQLHTDLRAGESTLFWFTTCGWMMWNYLVGALASEATVVLYDGSPAQPDLGVLWRLADRTGITHLGTSPKFLAALEKAGARPAELADLSALETVLSTGSPLNPEQFDWVYCNVKRDVQLASVSGGTDIIGCFAASAATLPVRRGELQCRGLGMAVEAWDETGSPVIGQKGELVCTRPFPNMPVGFWNDPDGRRYHEAYFAEHPGVWTHGDFVEIRPEGGVVIYGRSDTTLNPGGVRIGTAEIYRAIEPLSEIADAIVVGRPVDGDTEVVLCVVPAPGVVLDEALRQRIRSAVRSATTPRHVPRHMFAVSAVPYTISGKKVEKAVRQAITGEVIGNRDALANPEALDEYTRLPFDA